jgi:hypothetical protein
MPEARWSDVVATALLGTDRRPVPRSLTAAWVVADADEEPATQILGLAAQHRARIRAGSPLATAESPPAAPAAETEWASASAQELLGRLLDRPEPSTINHWLASCVHRGHYIWPEHWQPLAELATRTLAYDRLLLGRAIGARGIWFLHQNPAWSRLAAQIDAAVTERRSDSYGVAEPTSERTTAILQEIDAVFAAQTDDDPSGPPTAPGHGSPPGLHSQSIDRTEASGVS